MLCKRTREGQNQRENEHTVITKKMQKKLTQPCSICNRFVVAYKKEKEFLKVELILAPFHNSLDLVSKIFPHEARPNYHGH
jgi:hypothetical protein